MKAICHLQISKITSLISIMWVLQGEALVDGGQETNLVLRDGGGTELYPALESGMRINPPPWLLRGTYFSKLLPEEPSGMTLVEGEGHRLRRGS